MNQKKYLNNQKLPAGQLPDGGQAMDCSPKKNCSRASLHGKRGASSTDDAQCKSIPGLARIGKRIFSTQQCQPAFLTKIVAKGRKVL